MSKPSRITGRVSDAWDELAEQVKPSTPASAIEAMARQLVLMRDCAERIDREGAIVMDAKGNANEHPAIKIEREAAKQLRDWLSQYKNSKRF